MKSPEYHHMICIGKTKCTSEKGLLALWFGYIHHHRNTQSFHNDIKNNLKRGQVVTQNK